MFELVLFGPGTDRPISDQWQTFTLPIADINGGTDLSDVTNIVAFLAQEKAPNQTVYLRNIYFTRQP